MAEYVYVVMTEPNFSIDYGKCAPGDVLEVPKETAIRWRRVNIAKPASQEQVDKYREDKYQAAAALEEEEYITSDRTDEPEDTGSDFLRNAQPGNYGSSVTREESPDDDDDDEEEDEEG